MKKVILLLVFSMILLCSCGEAENNTEQSTEASEISTVELSFADTSNTLDEDWLFLPSGAELIRTTENGSDVQATFRGCEYPEINAYAKNLFKTLSDRGAKIYDAYNLLSPTAISEFKEAKLDINFAGVAYRYYYEYEDAIFMLELKYFGSAGGRYGNGQSILSMSNVTEKIGAILKEQ